jgi:predicted CXXCH cytochrome family protein
MTIREIEKGAQIMRKEGGAMKKLLFLGVGSALMFTMGGVGTAQADNGPHVSTAVAAGATATMGQAGGGRCASCHRAHTAKAEFLLKQAQPALCFSCHEAGLGASTDVVNGKNAYSGAALRGGGFSYALINGAAANKTIASATGVTPVVLASKSVPVLGVGGPLVPGSAVTSKHSIDGTTTGTMWGNGVISATVNAGKADVTLECASCHDPHGNGNYRILKPIPNDAGTLVQTVISPATTNATTGVVTPAELSAPAAGVNIPDAGAKVYTTADYWNVTDRNVPNVKGVALATADTDGYITNVSQWCATCHTRYLAGSGSYQINSGDAVFTYRHRSNRNNSAGVSRPNCIQCHVSHGSNVAMSGESALVGLPGQPTRSDPASPSSDSRLLRVNDRGTCVMCHNV